MAAAERPPQEFSRLEIKPPRRGGWHIQAAEARRRDVWRPEAGGGSFLT